jgi:hypothetical protein
VTPVERSELWALFMMTLGLGVALDSLGAGLFAGGLWIMLSAIRRAIAKQE